VADPIVRAVWGKPFLAPVTVNSGGTQLLGMDATRPIQLIQPQGAELERHTLEADGIRAAKAHGVPPMMVTIPAAGGDVNTLKLLWAANTSDGAAIFTDGTAVVKAAHTHRNFAMAIRPWAAADPFWYFPRLQPHPDLQGLLNRHQWIHQLAESNLILFPARPDTGTAPAAAMGTAAALDTLYGLSVP
jgi:hypothetical protein